MGHKPWTNTMHYEKPWTNTKGKKILDHPINTLWSSPHKQFVSFYTFYQSYFQSYLLHLFATTFHIVCWVYSIHSLIQIPIDNHRWRKSENQIAEVGGPHPQTIVVAHFIKVYCICFIKIRKSQNICYFLLVSQGCLFPLHHELYP